MTYVEAKATRDDLQSALRETVIPTDKIPGGLTPDAVKNTPEWKAAHAESNRIFAALRRHNTMMVKRFAKEMHAERLAKRQSH